MRGAPHVGFSVFMRRIKTGSLRFTFGRPGPVGIATSRTRGIRRDANDHRFGPDQNEGFGPVGPDLTNDYPKQAIDRFSLGRGCLRL
jgi:hypothetical protein